MFDQQVIRGMSLSELLYVFRISLIVSAAFAAVSYRQVHKHRCVPDSVWQVSTSIFMAFFIPFAPPLFISIIYLFVGNFVIAILLGIIPSIIWINWIKHSLSPDGDD